MRAELLIRERRQVAPDAFIDAKVWRVPLPVRASDHAFKYSLALVAGDVCVFRYDNEAGKGDHLHRGSVELPYRFVSIEKLMNDFIGDVREWLMQRTP
ncbi:hypothetical protein E3C22_20825 [Jiella endophytica]|uniref:Uncharacterized protein n=1 Tax=Jiella endophytica TaxID=2558362 RepID=A0A4Y8RBX6_9HYPH|nr:DUF6516 family protein [Jiella endophytica]TFF18676.1 hypothetical protein E3C22_20825 [Jiella endophytica]